MKKKQIKLNNEVFVIRLLRSNDELLLKEYFYSISGKMKKWYSPHLFNRRTAEEICRKKGNKIKRVIIISNKRIIGYCVLFFGMREWEIYRYNKKFKKNEICTIAPSILDDFQSIGLGTEMMKYIVEVSKYYNKKVIVLWGGVVLKNHQAINFYKKNKFKINKKWLHPIKKVMSYDMYLEI